MQLIIACNQLFKKKIRIAFCAMNDILSMNGLTLILFVWILDSDHINETNSLDQSEIFGNLFESRKNLQQNKNKLRYRSRKEWD